MAGFRGHEHECLIDELLDLNPQTILRCVRQRQIQRAFGQSLHQPFCRTRFNTKRNIGGLLTHPARPAQHEPVPQAELSANIEDSPEFRRERDFLPSLAPGPHHGHGVPAELQSGGS